MVDQCSLDSVAHKPIGKLSKGYRQRVSMAQALLHDPEVLILDEPTSGLDPNQIRGVRKLIRELGQSKTVLVSTHILQEVEPIAGRVLFIHDGRIVFDGKPTEMLKGGKTLEDQFHSLHGPARLNSPQDSGLRTQDSVGRRAVDATGEPSTTES